MKPKVLITNWVPPDHLEPLIDVAEIIYGPRGGELMPRNQVLRHLPQLDAIISQGELRVDDELLEKATRLKIVANVAIGVDNLDLDAMTRHNVWATNTPDSFTDTVADYTLGLLIMVTRRLHIADRYARSGQWVRDGFQPGTWDSAELTGRTLGVIGFGRTGRAVAQRARAFGLHVVYHNRSPRPEPGARSLDDLLAEADFISLHVPLTPQTHHLINARALSRMKRGAVLLNVARGKVVDEAALVEALASGHISAAGLDVAEREPHIHPDLAAMDNVVLTPHIAGAGHRSRADARRLCAQNIALVLTGEHPLTSVNHLPRPACT